MTSRGSFSPQQWAGRDATANINSTVDSFNTSNHVKIYVDASPREPKYPLCGRVRALFAWHDIAEADIPAFTRRYYAGTPIRHRDLTSDTALLRAIDNDDELLHWLSHDVFAIDPDWLYDRSPQPHLHIRESFDKQPLSFAHWLFFSSRTRARYEDR